MSQYFELFDLPAGFDLDRARLDAAYRQLAAQCHPDKVAGQSSFEQKQAMMLAATVNEAYRVLKSPLDRAAYLLHTQGIDADAPQHTQFEPAFLMQQMAWREALAEAEASRDEAALIDLDGTIAAEEQALFQLLQQDFAEQQYELAAARVRQGRFLHKLRSEIARAMP